MKRRERKQQQKRTIRTGYRNINNLNSENNSQSVISFDCLLKGGFATGANRSQVGILITCNGAVKVVTGKKKLRFLFTSVCH